MTQEVEDLRVHGIDLVRPAAGGDAELMALRPRLEQDTAAGVVVYRIR